MFSIGMQNCQLVQRRLGIVVELLREQRRNQAQSAHIEHRIPAELSKTTDLGYRGEIGVTMINHARNLFTSKIAQMIIQRVERVMWNLQTLCPTLVSKRFGSSGV